MVVRRKSIMHILSKGPTRDLTLRELHSYFQHPKSIQPTFLYSLHVSYQLSYTHQSTLLSFAIGRSHLAVAATSPLWPPLSLASPRPDAYTTLYHPIFTYIPSPISYSYPSFTTPLLSRPGELQQLPGPLPGELGNPPARRARALPAPPLTSPS